MSFYQLVYGKTCHLPIELEHKAHCAITRWNTDLDIVGIKRKRQHSELDEWREKAYHNAQIYKERTNRWHDKRIKKKSFDLGDKVSLFNCRVKLFGHKKLQSKWEGPYTLINAASHGAVTLQNNEGTLFKINGHRLKIFLEPNKNSEEIDIIDFIFFMIFRPDILILFFLAKV